MQTSRWLVVVVFVGLATLGLWADEIPEVPQPTEEHQKLATWVGKWAGSGEMKPGPFGPAGPMTWTEECDWFGGRRFHVLCTSEGTSPMGPMKGIGIIGYNPDKQVFTHYGVDNNGWAGHSEGIRTGNSWTYQSKDTMGGKTYHSRFVVNMETPTRVVMTWDVSEDGENWTTLMDGTSEKR